MSVRNYSTTPGSNNSAPPNGAPEGQSPGSVNNVIRQIMADVRDTFEQLPYFDFGHTPTRIDADTFTVPTDLTATYTAGASLKLVGATTTYVSVSSSSYSAPDTTVNVVGTVPTSLTTVSIGFPGSQTRYDQTSAELAASVTPTNSYIPNKTIIPVSVVRYGADPTGTNDSTSAFTQALAANQIVMVPEGTFRVDDKVFLNRDFLSLIVYGTIIRKASGSASTVPVVRVKGNYCSVIGIGPMATIQSENAAPHGVLLWGSENPGDLGGSDIVNSRHFLCANLRIRAKDAAGSQLTLALLSSQAYTSGALYDGIFNNLVLVGGEKQLYLNPDVAGNTFNNINFYETRGYGLYLDGAPAAITDCQFSNFFSDAAVSNITTYYGRNVSRCSFANMGGEPGGGSYKDFDASCAALVWTGYDNHPSSGQWLAGGSFYTANGSTKVESISFPATQVPVADPNTLDDYEEASFPVAPVIAGTTTAGAGTYAVQAGVYTKIGNRVEGEIYLDWTAHTGTGNIKISNLPFASNAAVPYSPITVRVSGLAMTAGNYLQGFIANGTTDITLEQVPTGGGAAVAIPMDAVASLIVHFSYRI